MQYLGLAKEGTIPALRLQQQGGKSNSRTWKGGCMKTLTQHELWLLEALQTAHTNTTRRSLEDYGPVIVFLPLISSLLGQHQPGARANDAVHLGRPPGLRVQRESGE